MSNFTILKAPIALINGAYGGMGQSIVESLATQGYTLALLGRDPKKLADLKGYLMERYPIAVACFSLDSACTQQIKPVIEQIASEFKKIDLFINAAGIVVPGRLHVLTENDWDIAIQINLMSVIELVKNISKLMIAQAHGRVILINGILSVRPDSNLIINSVTCAAISQFVKAIAKDLAVAGVKINVINPGATDTKLWDAIIEKINKFDKTVTKKEIFNDIIESIPSGKMTQTQEIAALVSFLSSPQADQITGNFINIDGGYCLS